MTRPHPLPALWLPAALVLALPGAARGGECEPPAAGLEALSLTEADVIALALRRNPALRMARHDRRIALLGAAKAAPALRPEITATASQFFNTEGLGLPRRAEDLVVIPDSVSRLELGLRMPLYQFGAGTAPRRLASASELAAWSGYRKAELDAILEVRELFVAVLGAEGLAHVAERSAELARETLRNTRLQRDQGSRADVDVLEDERLEAEAEAKLLEARNAVLLAKANLNRALGRPVEAPLSLVVGELPAPPDPLPTLLVRALEQRPELAALRQSIARARAGVRLAKASGLPRVNLQMVFSIQNQSSLRPGGELLGFIIEPRSFASAGVVITAPLFDGGLRRYTIREAEEQVEKARSGLAALESGVALEVHRHRLAVEEAQVRVEVAERAMAAAEKGFELAGIRVKQGRATPLELSKARVDLERARAGQGAAENAVRLARARLDRAVGDVAPGDVPDGPRQEAAPLPEER